MLRIQPYRDDIHRENLQTTLAELGTFEIQDFTEFQKSNVSYICTARTGVIQGFILVKETHQETAPYEIVHIGMMPRYRRQGYASRMIEMVKDKKQGVCTKVLHSNKDVVSLYQKLGFDVFSSGEYITYTWGIYYTCYNCKVYLKPSETIWETLPSGLGIDMYGLHPTMSLQSVCKKCRTKVES